MTRLCLDTSAYSNFQRGRTSVIEAIDQAEWIGVPTIVLGELRTGFLLGRSFELNAGKLERFLQHPSVQLLTVDSQTATIYSEIVVKLRSAGTPLPTNDIWIAATAANAGATVLTYDKHFQKIERVGTILLEGKR